MTDGAQRLAQHVLRRRRALGLSAADATRGAGINPKTWRAVESALRNTRDENYAKIERVLWWWPGSIDAILGNGEPMPVEQYLDPGDWMKIRVQITAKPADFDALESQYVTITSQPPITPAERERFRNPETGEVYVDELERKVWELPYLSAARRHETIEAIRANRGLEGNVNEAG